MSSRSALTWVALLAVLVFAATRALERPTGSDEDRAGVPGAGASTTATVTRVVDGDTVVVRLDGGPEQRLRYIGVDTPETVKPGTPVECFGKAASAYNHTLVEGKTVRLKIGRERFDRYGRLLAYVYLPGKPETFVNASLIERGYARTLAIAPNTDFASRLRSLERRAQQRNAGLWGSCPVR